VRAKNIQGFYEHCEEFLEIEEIIIQCIDNKGDVIVDETSQKRFHSSFSNFFAAIEDFYE